MKNISMSMWFVLLFAWAATPMYAQAPTGTISGTVTDASGAVIPSATVTVTNKATAASRTLTANSEGFFSAPALPAGEYEVSAEITGFRKLVRDAQVEAGSSTNVAMAMTIGTTSETVTVEAATAQINYDSNTLAGVIARQNIQDLPLNGRNFLQLAELEPGVVASAVAQNTRNGPVAVSVLGGNSGTTMVTVDGLAILDRNEQAGTALNFSQEIVQEFQLSSVNFDLSTGVTATGAINIVTRSGGNDFHGSVYMFYRDHNLSAYPGLKRNPLDLNPYFVRRNPGGLISGPIIKDKLFFFFNYEFLNQVQLVTVQPDLASIVGLASFYPSPNTYKSLTIRFDYKYSDKTSLFFRWTHDGNFGVGENATGFPESSNFTQNVNWSDQMVLGATTVISPTIVNDFRLGYLYWENNESFPSQSQCGSPCIGLGLPQITMLGSSNFVAGNNSNTPQNRIARNVQVTDTMSWQKGAHRIRFGMDFQLFWERFNYPFCQPGCEDVESIESTKNILGANLPTYMPNLPTIVKSTADLLNLPFYDPPVSYYSGMGAGLGFMPGLYHFASARRNLTPREWLHDTWKVRPNLTVNYGIGYEIDTGIVNADLNKPAYVAPLFGLTNQQCGYQGPATCSALSPTPLNTHEIAPQFGFAWNVHGGKTVIRGGAGMFWDTLGMQEKYQETWDTGPVGNGRVKLKSTAFFNIFPGIVMQGANGAFPALPIGAPIPTATFTTLTMAQFLQIYSQQYAALNAIFSPFPPQGSGTYSTTNIDLLKDGSELIPHNFSAMRSYQTSLGVQRDMGHGIVVQADWARRQFENTSLGEIDYNHYSEYTNGVQSPVIPKCTPSQYLLPGQECSNAGITYYTDQGRSIYEALLVKVNKQFSNHYQFVASYAYQNLNSTAVVNLNNWFQGYGPTLPRQNFNLAGIVSLPWGFELSMNSSMVSVTPVNAVTTGIDLTGTGATGSTPIPGLPFDCFGLSCSKSQLAAAVATFNATYAGTKAPNGTTIKQYILPPDYQFGDPTIAQDFRLTKTFTRKERYKLFIYAEMFNAFNVANLTGYSKNLDTVNANPAAQTFAFGQPTLRAAQIFLSGGPRAEQFGVRISF